VNAETFLAGTASEAITLERLAVEAGTEARLGAQKPFVQIESVRGLTKRDMLRNDAMPDIKVNPATFEVTADGERLWCEPAAQVPLARAHFLR
ncbi:MAG: urease subunit alpha, partial [Pseudomonadota bacterium]